MFRNYININDFISIYKKIKREGFLSNFFHIFKKNDQKVATTWDARSYVAPTNWWNIPEVTERWNAKITGKKDVNYRDYFCRRYLNNKKNLNGLVLGCGAGEKTILWAKTGFFKNIEACDISHDRIQSAKKLSKKNGVDEIINFSQKNIREIKNKKFDVIITENSLHHFSPMSDVIGNINSMLKDDGHFVMDEYVGPDRFQWTDRQLQAINGILEILPQKYKKIYNTNETKKLVHKTGRFFMKLSDPSEAVESSRILPCIHDHLEIIEEKPYGGSVMHMLFNSIAHNFISNDVETREWLKIIFSIEDTLIQNKDLNNDFIVGIYGKKYLLNNSGR